MKLDGGIGGDFKSLFSFVFLNFLKYILYIYYIYLIYLSKCIYVPNIYFILDIYIYYWGATLKKQAANIHILPLLLL